MRHTRTFLTFAGLAAIVLASVAVYVFTELERADADVRAAQTALEHTNADLLETHVALAQSNLDRVALEEANDRLEQDNADLQRDKAGLSADKDALLGYLNGALEANAVVTDDLQAAKVALAGIRVELVEAESQVTTLTGAKSDLEGRLGEMTQRFEARDAEYTTLHAQHQRLSQAAGDVDELEAEVTRLRGEVDTLEERRRPLLLAMQGTRVEGFLCTGSMEPKLTCLDTATWMQDFAPHEIVRGAIISFDNRACWSDAVGGRSAHRVVERRIVGGVYYYWPKGDAQANADGCWVPHTAVDGYVIEVQRNAVLANERLRDGVNASQAAYSTAWEDYLDAIEAFCGHREPHRCSVSLSDPLGQHAQTLWLRVREASDLYGCWYTNAATSQYPGHIPNPC